VSVSLNNVQLREKRRGSWLWWVFGGGHWRCVGTHDE